ncbi:MAG: hypothetical protein LC725_03080, partial [Lentisphaerae bacterium]|nr:hypothetical protein [Lentisphaerota bacterium]
MPVFVYTARTLTGEKVDGTVEAQDRHGALIQIERKGHVPVRVEEQSVKAQRVRQIPLKGLRWRRDHRPRLNAREMLVFTTELSDLLASGMKLGNALNT